MRMLLSLTLALSVSHPSLSSQYVDVSSTTAIEQVSKIPRSPPIVPGVFICSELGAESQRAQDGMLMSPSPPLLEDIVVFQDFDGCYRFSSLRANLRSDRIEPVLILDGEGNFRAGVLREIEFSIRGMKFVGFVFALE